MGKHTQVILLTGFLGCGKTTLLNRIVSSWGSRARLMVLMNEFGEIGIDGRLLQSDDLDVLEINKGSIFCACVKTDFIKGLMEIDRTRQPDLLIIEATGAADPADLAKSLGLSIFRGRFILTDQVCILDALNFIDSHHTFVSVEKQLKTASVFLINKTDLASPEMISAVRDLAMTIRPGARFIETSFAAAALEDICSLVVPGDAAAPEAADPAPPSPADLERAMSAALAGDFLNLSPPDRLLSAVYAWTGDGPDDFRRVVAGLPAKLVRGKGFLAFRDGLHLFNFTLGHGELTRVDPPRPLDGLVGRLVFIGPPEAMELLEAYSRTGTKLARAVAFPPVGVVATPA
ncbi:MAG: CobW family GTP-binding protein [Pseudomonadota bacterium]